MRSGRSADLDEPSAAQGRLHSLGLQREPSGWVPDGSGLVEVPPLVVAQVDAVAPVDVVAPAGQRPLPLDRLARAWLRDGLPAWCHGLVDRARLGAVAGGVFGVVALALAAFVLLHHGPGAGASGGVGSSYQSAGATASVSSDPVPSSAPLPTAAAASTSIVVDVGGRVRKPGLVTLPMGARVADALKAAGGPLRHKEIATLDLAARVSDGQLLMIGTGSATGASAPGVSDSSGTTGVAAVPISLSTATLEQLETLPGVGPVTAQKIVDWRTANNGFTSVEQLQQVSGIGPSHYAAISPLVTP